MGRKHRRCRQLVCRYRFGVNIPLSRQIVERRRVCRPSNYSSLAYERGRTFSLVTLLITSRIPRCRRLKNRRSATQRRGVCETSIIRSFARSISSSPSVTPLPVDGLSCLPTRCSRLIFGAAIVWPEYTLPRRNSRVLKAVGGRWGPELPISSMSSVAGDFAVQKPEDTGLAPIFAKMTISFVISPK